MMREDLQLFGYYSANGEEHPIYIKLDCVTAEFRSDNGLGLQGDCISVLSDLGRKGEKIRVINAQMLAVMAVRTKKFDLHGLGLQVTREVLQNANKTSTDLSGNTLKLKPCQVVRRE